LKLRIIMQTNSTVRTKGKILVAALLLGAMASTSVFAQHRGYYRGGARIGFYVGAPLLAYSLYRPYYYSPYYYPPAYYPPAAPLTYVEQPQQIQPQQQLFQPPAQSYQPEAPQAAPGNMWYYCNEARAYYPYVKTCPAGWQQVTPQPQG
jgi:hypothetical protein